MEQGMAHLIDFIKKKSERHNKKKLPPLSVKAVAISAYLRQKNLFTEPISFEETSPLEELSFDQEAFKSSQSEFD